MTSVELITIGDELLLGHTVDTNAAFLSRELAAIGLPVVRRQTAGDNEADIAAAVSAALVRSTVVICTGGLGPTQDDFTKPVVARLFEAPLEVDEALLAALRERFRLRGIVMSDRNVSQAEVPRGATVLPNSRGTAPGLALRRSDGHCCILLPGVPGELRALTVEQVIPFLRALDLGAAHPVAYRILRTTGLAESTIAEKLDPMLERIRPLKLAFLPGFQGTDVRITSWGELAPDRATAALDAAEHAIRAVLPAHIYGTDSEDLAAVVGRLLRDRGLQLALAESCTGGLLAKRMTDLPGSSDYFHSGVVAYSNAAKEKLLGVPAELIAAHGAVSDEVAHALVRGAQRRTGAGAAIAITGIAGPAGGTPDKPVGTVWLAIALLDQIESRRIVFTGDREEIRERAAQAALALLWKKLRATAPVPSSSAAVTS